ncbi:uncharacterized protein [Montipora foliosa]|uniref:uncharacterized protein n=1 Tax=Montipora foliosa TaxID=591990 RepID=UPI0035F1D24A
MKSVRKKLFGPVITKILVVASIFIQRQSATTEPATEMMTTNPKTQPRTTPESQDVGTTRRGISITLKVTKPLSKTVSSTVSQLSFPRKSPSNRMTIVFNPTKDIKDYTSITNITIISNAMDFKKIPDGSKSNVSWMIAALVGWAVVIVLFVWLMMLWKRLKKDPKKGDSTRDQPRKQSLPNHKTVDIEEEVTFMNLTEIRSQMSEEEGGYAVLNMQGMMRPTNATYTSLLKSEKMV